MTRWARFAAVGLAGFVVQLVTLWLLTTVAGVHDLVAVVASVEAAILHNFLWHERWTWRDRIVDPGPEAVAGRLLRFNTSTGAISLVGNAIFTSLFISVLGLPVIIANIAAITCLTLLNFAAADRFAFGAADLLRSRPAAVLAMTVALLSGAAPAAEAAELKPVTLADWQRYVAGVEARLARDTSGGAGGDVRAQTVKGEILVSNVAGGTVSVEGGTISHWRGYVFVPGVTVDELLDGAALRGRAAQHRQEDVLDARVLSRNADSLRLFLKLQRKAIVTVAYNTEHLVSFKREGPQRGSSRSISTRIAELTDAGTAHEREKPVGQDRGFMWRLNSYWRYQAVAGGVIVELESVTLSRDIPWAIRVMAAPLIDRIARESMTRTLASLRSRWSTT
jgi:putative flippase GtrA